MSRIPLDTWVIFHDMGIMVVVLMGTIHWEWELQILATFVMFSVLLYTDCI